MSSFDKKPLVRPPREPEGGGRLRPKLKEASKRVLEARRSLEKRQEPLRDHQKTKQKLTRDFIVSNAMFWTGKDCSLQKVRSLVLRDQQLHTFESTDTFKLHELAMIELLSLSHNHISSLQPLAELDSLQELNLNNNRIYDVSPLAVLQKLTSLYLNNNKVRDVTPLGRLPVLQLLHLYKNEVPYAEKAVVLAVAVGLTELDIEGNEVYKEEEKAEWMLEKMRKLNGQTLSVRTKELQTSKLLGSSKGFMSATQSGWRSGSASFRPTTACSQLLSQQEQLQPVTETQQNYLDIQSNLQEAENKYLRLDDQYEEEIVRNVKLKSELHRKMQLQKQTEKQQENLSEKREKCEQLRRTVAQMKENVFGGGNGNVLLKRLYEVTIKVEAKRINEQFGRDAAPTSTVVVVPATEQRRFDATPERPFDADEQIIFSDSEEERPPLDDEQYIRRLLNENDDTIEQLRRQLRELS